MSANWKNPFLNKEKLNVQQQIDKDFTCSELEIKLDAELKKPSKNIYTKEMRYIFMKEIYILLLLLFVIIGEIKDKIKFGKSRSPKKCLYSNKLLSLMIILFDIRDFCYYTKNIFNYINIYLCIIYRVSCEAIPEEIFGMGTTPPSSENTGEHPIALRSQRSYPGATQITQTISTTSNTVPPSPTTVQVEIIK